MELAFREFKLVVEPGGAVALAAALTGRLPVKGRAVAVVCSGGNVDHATFARALARARRMRMSNRVAESLEDLLLAQHRIRGGQRGFYGARVGEEPLRGMATGIASSLFIATPILLLEVKGRRLPLVRRLQRLPLVLYFAIRVVFYTIVIVVGLVAARLVVTGRRQFRARSFGDGFDLRGGHVGAGQRHLHHRQPARLPHGGQAADRPLRPAAPRAAGLPADRHEELDGRRRAAGRGALP